MADGGKSMEEIMGFGGFGKKAKTLIFKLFSKRREETLRNEASKR